MAGRYREYQKLNLPAIEQEMLLKWSDIQAFEKSIGLRENAPPFVFYEGPPSANALEPPGHWYVEVTAGARFSPGVTPQVHEAGKHPPGIVVLVAVALVLTALTCWAVL